jgi:hypothetical protein
VESIAMISTSNAERSEAGPKKRKSIIPMMRA